MTETTILRKTPKGRIRVGERIPPTYGTRAQRKARRQREALARQAEYDRAWEGKAKPLSRGKCTDVRGRLYDTVIPSHLRRGKA